MIGVKQKEVSADATSTGRWSVVSGRRGVELRHRSSPGFVVFSSILALVVGVFVVLRTAPWVGVPYGVGVLVWASVHLRGMKRYAFDNGDLHVFVPVWRWAIRRPRVLRRPCSVRMQRDWPQPRFQDAQPVHTVEVLEEGGTWCVVFMNGHEEDAAVLEGLLRRISMCCLMLLLHLCSRRSGGCGGVRNRSALVLLTWAMFCCVIT